MKKKFSFIVTAMFLAFLLVACNDEQEDAEKDQSNVDDTATEESSESTVSEDEKVEADAIVATVNGKEITGADYNMMYPNTKAQLRQLGQDVNDLELVKEQTLNSLINQELITQDADAKGIEVSSEEIDEQMEQVKLQFEDEEQFNEALANLKITEAIFKEQLTGEIKRMNYVEQEVPKVEVTDEQVEEYYNQLASQSDDVPKLEELKDQIKDQIAYQEEQSKLSEIVNQLMDNADVEKSI